MSEEFEFVWKVGDKCKFMKAIWVVSEVFPDELKIFNKIVSIYVRTGHEIEADTPKPRGKTKKRYKAEKLAWEQSRLKAGDWVNVNPKYANFEKGRAFKVDRICDRFKRVAIIDGKRVNFDFLKPAKPPKQEILGSDNFRIEDGNIIFTGELDADSQWGKFWLEDGGIRYIPHIAQGYSTAGWHTTEYLREIATLLEQYSLANSNE